MLSRLTITLFALTLGVIGFTQTVNISAGGSFTQCAGNTTDSDAAAGSYGPNENYMVTICSDGTGNTITLDFSVVIPDIDISDQLLIYDGNGIGAPLIGTYNNGNVPVAVSSTTSNTSGCLTLVFVSDGAVEGAGWDANIICGTICQPILPIITTTPALVSYGPDSNYTNICPGDTVLFMVAGTYPDNGVNPVNYAQSDATSTFDWNFGEGTSATGTNPSNSFAGEQGYLITLEVTDANGCMETVTHKVRTGITPTFSGISINPDTTCFGDTVELLGGYNTVAAAVVGADPNTGFIGAGGIVSGVTFLPDGSGTSYSTTVNIGGFGTQTIAAGTDITSVCMEIEHSYIGDLDMTLTCPNGTVIQLMDTYTGSGPGNVFLGDALDDGSTTPGTCMEYCFDLGAAWGNMTAENTAGNTIPSTVTPGNQILSPGSFQPLDNFNLLIGCPIDGNWTLTITDNIGADNGYICEWGIAINPAINPNSEFYTVGISNGEWISPTVVGVSDSLSYAVPDSNGVYFYTFQITDEYGCTFDTIVDVFVLPEMDPIVSPDTIICPGQLLDLIGINAAAPPVSSCSYCIYLEDTFGDGWNGGALSILLNGAVAGTFTLATGSFDTICFPVNDGDFLEVSYAAGSFASEVIYSIADPSGAIIFSDGDGITAPITGIQTIGNIGCTTNYNFIYSWTPPTDLTTPNSDTTAFIGSNTTTYTFTMAITGFPQCTKTSLPITVTVQDTLVLPSVTGDTSLCIGEFTTLTVNNALSQLWPDGSVGTSVTFIPTADTTLLIQASTACQTYNYPTTVIVNPDPAVNTINDTTIPIDLSVDLITTSSGTSFIWGPSIGLDCFTCESPAATPPETTTYIVEITDANGCKSYDTVTVIVEYLPLFIPNGFSPNGDGSNDLFLLRGSGIALMDLQVFDRWGVMVFETKDQLRGWDGTFQGQNLNTDVFVYKCDVLLKNGEELRLQGNLTLFR
jgi:gliding motility-associated-like protein